MLPALPKPKQIRKQRPAVKVFRDGRECCDLTIKAGKEEYFGRVTKMLSDQKGKCGLQITPQCRAVNGRLSREFAQFGHPKSRKFGGGARDDRLEIDGKPSGAMALCPWCNAAQGSRPISDFVDPLIP